ncbi:conserved hypothetical protein [Vibrio chagasii]|nr:conserved hypothetical protein [Vibrio chagasii]
MQIHSELPTAEQSDLALKARLQQARKSTYLNIELTNEKKLIARKILKDGGSKKALCMVLGVDYKELKRLLNS